MMAMYIQASVHVNSTNHGSKIFGKKISESAKVKLAFTLCSNYLHNIYIYCYKYY